MKLALPDNPSIWRIKPSPIRWLSLLEQMVARRLTSAPVV